MLSRFPSNEDTAARTRRRFLAVFVLLVALCLYLAFGDLGAHKERIEQFVTQRIGREFAIDRPFSLKVIAEIRLQAEQCAASPMLPGARRLRCLRSDAFAAFHRPVVSGAGARERSNTGAARCIGHARA